MNTPCTAHEASLLDQSGQTPGRGKLNMHYLWAATCRPWESTDEYFAQGTNGLVKYNNKGATSKAAEMERTTHEKEKVFSPNPTGNIIRFTTKGDMDAGVTPGYGGFYPGPPYMTSFPNGCFIQRMCANLPPGYCFNMCSNAIGNDSKQYWLTPSVGTGKWEYYVCVRECGETGSFSSTGHICVSKEGQPRDAIGHEKLTWYLSSYQAYTV